MYPVLLCIAAVPSRICRYPIVAGYSSAWLSSLACRPPAQSLRFCLSNMVYSHTQSTVQASTQEPLYSFCADAGTPVVRPWSPLYCV